MTHIFSTSALVGVDLNNNCYNDTTNLFGYNGSAYSTVATFNGATGFEANGIGNGSVALSNVAGEDFTLTTSSSCKNLGEVGLGISTDFSGKIYETPPSSGAYQY